MWAKALMAFIIVVVLPESIVTENFENSCSAIKNETSPTIEIIYLYENKASLESELKHLVVKTLHLLEERSSESQCLKDVAFFLKAALNTEMWALKMIDSFAKPPSGFLEGRSLYTGEYNECINVRAPPRRNSNGFNGQYCTLEVHLGMIEQIIPMEIGTCFPSTCDSSEILENLKKGLKFASTGSVKIPDGIKFSKLTCQIVDKPFEPATIAMIIFLCCVVFCSIVGTLVELLEAYRTRVQNTDSRNPENGCDAATVSSDVTTVSSDSEREIHKDEVETKSEKVRRSQPWQERIWNGGMEFFRCFGLSSNYQRLISTKALDDVNAFHGLKTLGMTWIILCHVSGFIFPVNTNFNQFFRVLNNWISQLVLNGFYAVDIFFFISGFLLSVSYFRYTERRSMSWREWLMFYFHRILRIGALYYTFIALYASDTYAHLGSGPLWHGAAVTETCRKFWLYNVLFINNFQSTVVQCLQWSWYLANDMQFFVFSPPILYLLNYYSNWGIGSVVLLLLISAGANCYMTYSMDLITGLSNMPIQTGKELSFLYKFISYFDSIYVRPYSRMAPYLIGLLMGFLFVRKWSRGIRKELNIMVLSCGWFIFGCIIYYTLFGLYRVDPPLWFACIHNALNRHVFGGAMAWLVYLCVTGQGGWINSFLSWRHFTIPSRLTYCVYLLHPVLYNIFLFSQGSVDFNYYVMIVYFVALYVISFLLAIPISLLFEAPVMRLEKSIRTALLRSNR